MHHQARRDGFLISTDPELIDLDVVHAFLREVNWSRGIPRQTLWKGIQNSITFGVYETGAEGQEPGTTQDSPAQGSATRKQVGFARVITDIATFAYLSDVFIVDGYRGRGLSKWLMEVIL